MNKSFYAWNFASDFGKEMVSAEEVYNSMKANGLQDFTYSKFDYHFVCNDKSKLEAQSARRSPVSGRRRDSSSKHFVDLNISDCVLRWTQST